MNLLQIVLSTVKTHLLKVQILNDKLHSKNGFGIKLRWTLLNEDNKEAFDEEKTADINDFYLNSIGYKETPIFKDGLPVHDPATGKQKVSITVQRLDLPYEKFVRGFVSMMEDWADDAQADTVKNIVKQKSNQGIRPGGTSKRGIGALRPGDISKMTDEEYEKYEDDIDQKILKML
jgi:hypothetical protein